MFGGKFLVNEMFNLRAHTYLDMYEGGTSAMCTYIHIHSELYNLYKPLYILGTNSTCAYADSKNIEIIHCLHI